MKSFLKYKRIILLSLSKHLVLIFFLLPIISFSQNKEDDKNSIIEKRIEYLVEDAEESNADYTTIFDQLSYFYNHPLNLNRDRKSVV